MARPRKTASNTPRKGPRNQRTSSARSTRSTRAKPGVERPQQAYVLVPHLRDVLALREKKRKKRPRKNVLVPSAAQTLGQEGTSDTAETALHHFLRTIKPGIDLSPHIDLLRKSGVGDMQALANLGQWEDADLRKALAEMYSHAGLTEVQLVALRQAIQKLALVRVNSDSMTASVLRK
ncbi:hypothetical protein MKEN_00763200 [Mycena kentingensis (nom. inval.)]|nr:hypothetical protein MKEN_00763200 [Mycena kentingensis (nom. inval.)]